MCVAERVLYILERIYRALNGMEKKSRMYSNSPFDLKVESSIMSVADRMRQWCMPNFRFQRGSWPDTKCG